MKKDLVKHIILYLVDQLQDNDSPISTIRLIKFLYLLDLEYYNRHFQTLTEIDWIKYHYGPFFFEWPELIKEIGYRLSPSEIKTERGEGFLYQVDEPYRIDDKVTFGVQGMINRIIQKWGDEDIDEILNYVYETLPVKESEQNEQLDFSVETDHLLL